jgi:hypothetical protein
MKYFGASSWGKKSSVGHPLLLSPLGDIEVSNAGDARHASELPKMAFRSISQPGKTLTGAAAVSS